MKTILKYPITVIGCVSWCGLGFARGVNSYKYTQNKYNKIEPFIYSNSIIHGFFGIIMYVNPILLPITIHKELYRLEINIRNLENEKKSRYYNDLI
jgi:hypothetical protein